MFETVKRPMTYYCTSCGFTPALDRPLEADRILIRVVDEDGTAELCEACVIPVIAKPVGVTVFSAAPR